MSYQDTDWSSHLRTPEAFYAEALPCESCGRPVDGERKNAWWDGDLKVGPCCTDPLYDDIPLEATCEDLFRAVGRCTTVAEVRLAMSMHVAECEHCKALRPAVAKIEPAYVTISRPGEMDEHVFPNRRKAA